MSSKQYYLKIKLYNFVPRSLKISGENTKTDNSAHTIIQPSKPAICRLTAKTITPISATTKKIGPN